MYRTILHTHTIFPTIYPHGITIPHLKLHFSTKFKPHPPTELLFLYIQNPNPFPICPSHINLFSFFIGFPPMASPDLTPNSSSSCHNAAAPRLKRKRREAREVRRKVQKLRCVVPGGRQLQREHLFAKTAHYILHLRLKVCALETILKLQDQA